MPILALILGFAFFLIAVVWRSSVQYMRTRDHGLRVVTGRSTGIDLVAAILIFLGIILIILSPILLIKGLLQLFPSLTNPIVQWIGLGVAIIGILCTSYAQWHMGASWRIGVDQTEVNALVTTGPFTLVRNPIFSSIMVFGLGLFLLVPEGLMLVGLVLTYVSIQLQVRYIEEPFLLRTHGEAYRLYTAQVGRFMPGLGRLRM